MISHINRKEEKPATKNKEKVLLVINSLKGGGAERVVLTLGEGFFDLGYEVHILRFKPQIEFELSSNLNYHMLKFKSFKLIPKLDRRERIFARAVDMYVSMKIGEPKIVISNLDRADSILSHSHLPNIVYVIHNTLSLLYDFNNTENSQKKLKFAKVYSKNPSICVSKGVQKDFIETFKEIKSTTAIYNPIDKDDIQKQADAFIPEYKDYIIHVGSFKDAKRHDVLVKAYSRTDKSMPLLLLGQGEHKNEIERLVDSLNLKDKVLFLGFCSNPYPYIKHAKFKVLTSDWEGCPLVIPEALALGTPVISTDCPSGPKEMLPENNLMPMQDVEAIAEKMRQAMDNPQNFYSTFDEELLPINIAKKYLDFIESTK